MPDKQATSPARPLYVRFGLSDRIQHAVMLLSFTTLAVTGLIQKFPLNAVSVFVVRLWGGIESVRATHHVAATVLMLVAIYHLVEVGYRVFVLRSRMNMLPTLQDGRDALNALMFNVGLSKTKPQYGRYGFEEKAEYWALVWGILIMAITGFMMWNPLATVSLLPGEFIPAAKTAHGAEAILAVLAIIVWHMYAVHIRRFNKSMWTGAATEEQMLHEHPLELADIKAGLAGQRPSDEILRRRQLIYYPIAAAVSAGLLFAVYGFVNGEQTAITTAPPAVSTIPIFVPQTPTPVPATPTPLPSATPADTATESSVTGPTWNDVSTVLAARCAVCHAGSVASGNLLLDSYASALQGGKSGPAITPGDGAGSKLVLLQTAGGHPGQLTAEELALVQEWIDGGAPEQ